MSRLDKKLDELSNLLKNVKAQLKMPKPTGVKPPKAPGMPKLPKLPGQPSQNKKDPTKVAEQIANPENKDMVMDQANRIKESLKTTKNGQWNIQKSDMASRYPDDDTAPMDTAAHRAVDEQVKQMGIVDAEKQGLPGLHGHPEQHDLIHGMDFGTAVPINEVAKQDEAIKAGVTTGAAFVNNPNHKDQIVAKPARGFGGPEDRHMRGHADYDNFNAAKREAQYHNMARDFFGLGDAVPTTTAFNHQGDDWSAQRKVDASHPQHYWDENHKPNEFYTKVLDKMHGKGDLHKLALMDNIMGHHDRHTGNYLVNNNGNGLSLIDNGTSFDYQNVDPNIVPLYIRDSQRAGHEHNELHPEAKKWLLGLNEKKAEKLLQGYGHDASSKRIEDFKTRLRTIKDAVRKGEYKSLEDLLDKSALSTDVNGKAKENIASRNKKRAERAKKKVG